MVTEEKTISKDTPVKLVADGVLKGRVHYFPINIYYEDTDLSGRVYHANYLRFTERARSDLVKLIGINQRLAYQEKIGMFVIHAQKIRYCQPAWLDDRLEIQSRVIRLRAATFQLQQQVFRDAELLTEVESEVAFLSVEGRPCRIPAGWRPLFESLCLPASDRVERK